MDRKTWRRKIKAAAKEAGTYRNIFDPVVDTLAGILERRDNAEEMFEKSGGSTLVDHTNKNGSTNVEQNPALRMINDLNRDALTYWRELGLTPAGLKKLNEQAAVEKKASPLEEALLKIGGA